MICGFNNIEPCSGLCFLGCFPNCSKVSFSEVPLDGDYLLKYDFNGSIVIIELNGLTQGDQFTIDTSWFNECAEICFQIIKPDGGVFEYDNDDEVCNKFVFTNSIYLINNPTLDDDEGIFDDIGSPLNCF